MNPKSPSDALVKPWPYASDVHQSSNGYLVERWIVNGLSCLRASMHHILPGEIILFKRQNFCTCKRNVKIWSLLDFLKISNYRYTHYHIFSFFRFDVWFNAGFVITGHYKSTRVTGGRYAVTTQTRNTHPSARQTTSHTVGEKKQCNTIYVQSNLSLLVFNDHLC